MAIRTILSLRFDHGGYSMDFDLTGHRAFVTGSSRGIGSAIALELARGGADVIVHASRLSEKAKAVSDEIRKMGRESSVIAADLCSPEAVEGMLEALPDVDIIVLNASMQIRKTWTEITVKEYEQQMNCNFLASLMLIQHCSGYMAEKGWGRIVTIGSVILNDSTLVRRLVVLGFDTLEVHGDAGIYGCRWQLKDHIQIGY